MTNEGAIQNLSQNLTLRSDCVVVRNPNKVCGTESIDTREAVMLALKVLKKQEEIHKKLNQFKERNPFELTTVEEVVKLLEDCEVE